MIGSMLSALGDILFYKVLVQKKNELDRLKMIVGGYFKATHLGDTIDFYAKESANSLAFKADAIAPHTDISHFEYAPDFSSFHCLKQSRSGAFSILIDGFKIAQHLREQDPESYKLLANHRLTYRDL